MPISNKPALRVPWTTVTPSPVQGGGQGAKKAIQVDGSSEFQADSEQACQRLRLPLRVGRKFSESVITF